MSPPGQVTLIVMLPRLVLVRVSMIVIVSCPGPEFEPAERVLALIGGLERIVARVASRPASSC